MKKITHLKAEANQSIGSTYSYPLIYATKAIAKMAQITSASNIKSISKGIITFALISFFIACSSPSQSGNNETKDSLQFYMPAVRKDTISSLKHDSLSQIQQYSYDSIDKRLKKYTWNAREHESFPQKSIDSIINTFVSQGLVDVQTIDGSLLVALAYATSDNFVGFPLYPVGFNQAYLQPAAAQKLKKAHQLLMSLHPKWRLIIFDAARPQSVQFQMWNKVVGTAQQSYVAEPTWGSMHNFGCSVDLSVYDIQGDSLLDMGTTFDNFTRLAQPRHEQYYLRKGQLSQKQHRHRMALRNAMLSAGFRMVNHEWWHFEAFSIEYIRKKYKIIP